MHIHFIGIGGIGVSALAKYYCANGATVTGSDLTSSEIIEELERLGVKIIIGKHKKINLPKGVDKVIYTPAVGPTNPEFKKAKERGIVLESYPEAVGDLTRRYRTITISGAHGKSTTSALVGRILEEGYFDPLVIVGAKVKEFGDSNFRQGRGGYMVLEADEWNKSFLHYQPQIAVITNIDREHLDTYGNVEKVEQVFFEYLAAVPYHGAIVANFDDMRTRNVVERIRARRVHWYSLRQPEAGMVRNLLRIPGEHNVANALAGFMVGRVLGIPQSAILKAIAEFGGVWRRFELKGMVNGSFLFTDYGHHPNEIRATLAAARERFPFRRIWCVYQPHQRQRLLHLWDDFVRSFDDADNVCLLPVYDVAGREKERESCSAGAGRETRRARAAANSQELSRVLQERGKNASYCASFEEVVTHVSSQVRPRDVVFIMGAGDIYDLTKMFSRES